MNEPRIAPEVIHNAPVTNVGDNSPQSSATINDRTGLYIAILALAIGGMALGFEISRAMATGETRALQEQAIDAKIQAGIERARADMQQQVEQAKSAADAGATDGRLALDRVEKAVAKLEAKGLIKESH